VPKPATDEEEVEDGRDELTLDTGTSAFFVLRGSTPGFYAWVPPLDRGPSLRRGNRPDLA
jgi:hypothetical protein